MIIVNIEFISDKPVDPPLKGMLSRVPCVGERVVWESYDWTVEAVTHNLDAVESVATIYVQDAA